jgi:outer membrane protein assembly factor BamB
LAHAEGKSVKARFSVQLLCVLLLAALGRQACGQADLENALQRSPIQGGLCVILGSADADLAAGVARRGTMLVHCLSSDAAAVNAARQSLLKQGVYGTVAVEARKDATLPYADNLVSLLVVLDAGDVPRAELLRVLRPDGQLLLKQAAGFQAVTKPKIEGTDEWTHWRHGPERNAASNDRLVDVPRRIQWLFTSKAITERSHLVLANGRAFAQDREWLIARDAFNGLPLWKTAIQRGNDFDWEYSVKVAALIVAKGERVYARTKDDKLTAFDAATGKPVMTYTQAGTPYHILLVDDGRSKLGTLVLATKDAMQAVDAESGKLLWSQPAEWPHNPIACNYAVFYIEGNDRRGATSGDISARDLSTGKLLWKKNYYWARRTELASFGYDRIVYEMRSPFNWREFYAQNPKEKEQDKYALVVISAKTGEELRKMDKIGTSARHGEFRTAFWHKDYLVAEAVTREGLSIVKYALDDLTKPAVTFKANYVGDRGFGHCYPPVLTDRYYINGQLNFTDLESRKQVSNQITRGACNTARSGYLPANGMIYTLPKHCVCFPMLDGSACLAPADGTAPPEGNPLVRGPAWPAAPVEADYARDWPTFRHDEYRSGGTAMTVPEKLDVLWSTQIPGPDYAGPLTSEWLENPYTAGNVTAPVVAEGLVYAAQSDTHRLVALDDKTGKPKWQFVADGRIDRPPTIHRGMCLVGSRDGWVYNLRAADGQLIWRLRVAPNDRRISSYGQLESPWPVAGSVLICDGLAYVSAGVHPNSDGGVRVVCFNPESGSIVWQKRFDDLGFAGPWPEPFEPRGKRPDSDPWRTIRPMEYRYFDLPVRDGDSVAVSRCLFDLKTGKSDLQKATGFYHVKSSGAYVPRTSWRYNDARPYTPLAVCQGSSVFTTIPNEGKLFRTDFDKTAAFQPQWVQVSETEGKAGWVYSTGKIFKTGTKWAVEGPDTVRAMSRAMLVAGDNLFIATPRNTLQVYKTADGAKAAEIKTEPLAWDGLAAARGKLYLTTRDGKVVCMGAKSR